MQQRIGVISAKIIKDSIHGTNQTRLITLEVDVPRFLLAQINTHRMIVKNYQSSRAVPVAKLAEQAPFVPHIVGKNKVGMAAAEYLSGDELAAFQDDWLKLRQQAVDGALQLCEKYNLHKQLANRLLEPFSMCKGVLTGTLSSWEHVIKLRKDGAAQPEFQQLAMLIEDAIASSTPQQLELGQWHLPYVDAVEAGDDGVNIKIAASCIAQVSYRKLDDSPEKALSVFDKLDIFGDKPHISPLQHIACAQDESAINDFVFDAYLNNDCKYYAEFGNSFVQASKYVENDKRLFL